MARAVRSANEKRIESTRWGRRARTVLDDSLEKSSVDGGWRPNRYERRGGLPTRRGRIVASDPSETVDVVERARSRSPRIPAKTGFQRAFAFLFGPKRL
ncbi:hypothetical protein EA472_13510 [Natrarchaeobius oligotrophus]|uniref:Uncharacterized protein n=1 Tax=Natrarchaeobius chitinivorans TaxID=1679083 RepID=A0A3N6PGY7_NATCH|nr:hypothetical protein EA472_13510 [Natrarchaeobius chitinivorans]